VSPWNVFLDWPPNWNQWRASAKAWFGRLSSWILIGLLAQLAVGIWISGSGISSNVDESRGFTKPIIAFELAMNPHEANQVLGEGEGWQNWVPMQKQFHRDFFFILSYALTYVLLGWALFAKDRGLSLGNVASVALIVLGLWAGGMDVLENVHGLSALQQHPISAGDLVLMRSVSLVKWTLLGVLCIPTAYVFWPARGWTLFRIISKVASALLILAACVFAVGELSPNWEHRWEFSVACMVWSGAFQVLILVLWAPEFELSLEKKRHPERT
jgi:hypothetical protein